MSEKPFQVGLIRIIIHTLAAHAHVCDRYSKPYAGFAARSRDMSQLSLEEEDDCHDTHPNINQAPQEGNRRGEEDVEQEIVNQDIGNKITIFFNA